mmetsp:Transcript_72400/g.154980  ORF Transcript_72400/g.154980 Transcript_72400/m.154980 type:complete len:239 (+) Transcript_72400:386-1102(+)
MLVAQIVDFVWRRLHARANLVQRAQAPADDVVDVGEVTLKLRAAWSLKDAHGLLLHYLVRKGESGHVWAAMRTVDSEEAQTRDSDTGNVIVGVRNHLVRLLRGRIEACGTVDDILLREGYLGVQAVDGARGGVDEARNRLLRLYNLQESHEPGYIRGNVGVGVLRRIAHTGLCRKVQDVREAAHLHGLTEYSLVVQIRVNREDASLFQLESPLPLQGGRVVGVEIVQAKNPIAPLAQS